MVKKILIRKAEIRDVKGLVNLDKKASKEISWWIPIHYPNFSKFVKKGYVYIAEQNEEIIGYISGKKDKKNFVFEDMYVIKQFRGQKIATNLVKRLLQEVKFKSKNIQLKCPERLRKFYEKFGFKVSHLVMKK